MEYRWVRLTKGQFARVDEEDYEAVERYAWRAVRRTNCWYAETTIKGRLLGMHQLLIGSSKETPCDHIDRNGLNNTKRNLRFCTPMQNQHNSGPQNRAMYSPFKGVTCQKSLKKRPWRAYIRVKRRQLHLGFFSTPEDAARAYDYAAQQYFGDFARVNFP